MHFTPCLTFLINLYIYCLKMAMGKLCKKVKHISLEAGYPRMSCTSGISVCSLTCRSTHGTLMMFLKFSVSFFFNEAMKWLLRSFSVFIYVPLHQGKFQNLSDIRVLLFSLWLNLLHTEKQALQRGFVSKYTLTFVAQRSDKIVAMIFCSGNHTGV